MALLLNTYFLVIITLSFRLNTVVASSVSVFRLFCCHRQIFFLLSTMTIITTTTTSIWVPLETEIMQHYTQRMGALGVNGWGCDKENFTWLVQCQWNNCSSVCLLFQPSTECLRTGKSVDAHSEKMNENKKQCWWQVPELNFISFYFFSTLFYRHRYKIKKVS